MRNNSKILIIAGIILGAVIIIASICVAYYLSIDTRQTNATTEISEEEQKTEPEEEIQEPEIKLFSDEKEKEEIETNLSKIYKSDIYYVFGDETVYVKDNLKDWITEEGDNAIFDEEAVREFVNGLSRKYDTFGISRQFKTHDGEIITVKGGTYGWWMNRPEETKQLIESIKNGDSGQRTPVYYSTAVQYGENDIGNTYIEADLTKQHLWVYEDGVVIEESDFVSGNISKGFGTHTGTYGITYKERNATLAGQGYSSPVSYWMPFNENEGLHDASWRDEFGGEIYLRNGSHGCLNLPPNKAASIYEKVYKDEPVVVYGGKTEVPALTPEEQIALLIQAGLLNPDGTPIDAEGVNPAQTTEQPAVEQQPAAEQQPVVEQQPAEEAPIEQQSTPEVEQQAQ